MTLRSIKLTVSKLAAVAALAVAGFATPASAAITSGVKVQSIEQTAAGNVFVHFDANMSGGTCSNRDVLYINGTTTAGRNLLSSVTAALIGNKTVNVNFSSASCVSNTHTMSWIHLIK
jgi:hypothetical protein